MTNLEINLQNILNEKTTKILPENIKKDVQIFDVVGTLEEGASTDIPVKLFKTQEEMQADTTAKEGDLALVYDNSVVPMSEGSSFDTLYLPEKIVLSEPYTSDSTTYMEFGSQCSINKTEILYQISYFGEEIFADFQGNYTSEDGITYTRTSVNAYGCTFKNDILSLPTKVALSYEGMGTDNKARAEIYGPMIFTQKNFTFNGLYNYKQNAKEHSYKMRELSITNYNFDNGTDIDSVYTGQTEYTGINIGNIIYKYLKNYSIGMAFLDETKENIYLLSTVTITMVSNGVKFFPHIYSDSKCELVKYNISSGVTTNIPIVKNTVQNESGTVYIYIALPDECYWHIGTYQNGLDSSTNLYNLSKSISYKTNTGTEIEYSDRYIPSTTQLTCNEKDILPGIVCYGEEGITVGDGSIYNNLDIIDIVSTKTSSSDYDTGVYIKADLSSTNFRGIATKSITNDVDKLKDSLAVISKYTIPEKYKALFVEDASKDNTGIHTYYIGKYVIKDNNTSHNKHTIYIFSPDFKTVYQDGLTMDVPLDTFFSTENEDILHWFGYGAGGTLNVLTGEVTTISSAPSGEHGYGCACIVEGNEYYATQTALYKNGAKLLTLSMVTNGEGWGYLCRYLNGYVYVIPISGTDRQIACVNLSDNSVTYIDITSLTSYIQFVESNSSSSLYFVNSDSIYKLNGTSWSLAVDGISSYWHQPVRYGYISFVKVKEIDDIPAIISLTSGKVKYGENEYNLAAYNVKPITSWSSEANDRVLINGFDIYGYDVLDEYVKIIKLDYTSTSGNSEYMTLMDTGRTDECIVLPKTLNTNYTGTISPMEYDTAVTTSQDILGNATE